MRMAGILALWLVCQSIVVGVDLGDTVHLEAVLLKLCESRNQAGEGGADGKLGNAVSFMQNLHLSLR